MFGKLLRVSVRGRSAFRGIVQWSDWRVQQGEAAPLEFHFDAVRYDAEPARVEVGAGTTGRPDHSAGTGPSAPRTAEAFFFRVTTRTGTPLSSHSRTTARPS